MASLADYWLDSLQAAYRYARGERAAELRDSYVARFDGRRLHPFSVECGRVEALQDVEPVLREAGFDPVMFRLEAREDARREFLDSQVFS